jgi:hypothetical protein
MRGDGCVHDVTRNTSEVFILFMKVAEFTELEPSQQAGLSKRYRARARSDPPRVTTHEHQNTRQATNFDVL